MATTLLGTGLTYHSSFAQTTATRAMLDGNTSTTATTYQIGHYILVAQIQSLITGTQPPMNYATDSASYTGAAYIIPWPTMYFNVSYGGSATYTAVTSVTGYCTNPTSTRTFSATATTYTALAGVWVNRGYLGDSEAPNTAYCLYQLYQRIS